MSLGAGKRAVIYAPRSIWFLGDAQKVRTRTDLFSPRGSDRTRPQTRRRAARARHGRRSRSWGLHRHALLRLAPDVVQRDDSQLVRGQVREDGRHIANYAVNSETYKIECPGGTCTRVAFRSCQPEVNSILFAPLSKRADGAMWTCDEVEEMLAPGVLFPADALMFPQTGC